MELPPSPTRNTIRRSQSFRLGSIINKNIRVKKCSLNPSNQSHIAIRNVVNLRYTKPTPKSKSLYNNEANL